ncbi:alternative ribosome rescue aminoacyl-tRNA hydrolase ArfB [Formosa sp. PL04]|uniref:alternative ribosome rescue aminoacyl-tRNA hydrolase ArfB n=1 Tax=Formosa sp. PL04 TaxID=3081755 RepID=UPI00298288BE|nr:alternative ribosome rescue aminoacyl-tRNA hydrolase ArfB [Formosa sp. PL04]MDW5287256.1 alternative ribosome rescue aminoacyl-tRNA hydrolase ArfB [Formosa sp. PL04]
MIDETQLISELSFKAVRSSGAGGQHVNKVSSKVELSFSVLDSSALNEGQKERLITKLQPRLTKNQVLLLQCDESRSQHKNKELVISRFLQSIHDGLKVQKKRRPTRIPKSAIKKRLKGKRVVSERKVSRRKPNLD